MQRLKCTQPRVSDRPEHPAILLVTSERGERLVASCCERAEAAGVRAGMSLAHAGSLLKDGRVLVQSYVPDENTRALAHLARWTLRFSPVVAPDYPDGLFMDIAGCERLFGGERRHVEQIATALDRLGFPARLAVAPTFGCAWAVARYGKDHVTLVPSEAAWRTLAPLPVAGLRIDERIEAGLAEVEIERIGQLFELPRAELAARFGSQLLGRLDQATGVIDEQIEPIQPVKPLEVTREFDGPVKRIEAVETAVGELLSRLLAELRKQGSGARRLDVELCRVDLKPERFSLSLTYPSQDGNHLWALIRPKIERLHLGYGVEGILLRAARTERVSPEQMELWQRESCNERACDATALGELFDRLIDQIGGNAVTRVEPVETHVPERAFTPTASLHVKSLSRNYGTSVSPAVHRGREARATGNFGTGSKARRTAKAAGTLEAKPPVANRPSRLFEVPEPVRVIALAPDGPPAWLRWRGRGCAVLTTSGPERIAPPWWQGGRAESRDYYEVQDEHGRWLWVFRERASGRWFVHGEWS